MPVTVEDRDIYVNTGGQSQTVKICDCRNIRGEYEYYFRIRPVDPQFNQEQMVAELQRRADMPQLLVEVIAWLQTLGGNDELAPGAVVGPVAEGDEPPPQAPPIAVDLPQPWFNHAVSAVERAIDHLVDEFSEFPYMHRVEHCLHTRLVQMLREQWPLGGSFGLGNTGEYVQLIHKEWPETTPRDGKNGRRGNFDVVALSPQLVANCHDLNAFLEGRLAAPIVIEIGLGYGLPHLVGDHHKLINSLVPAGYLLHLVRGRPPEEAEINLLEEGENLPDVVIRKACVFVHGQQRWIKRTGDNAVHHEQAIF
jgi:hypothetical protein